MHMTALKAGNLVLELTSFGDPSLRLDEVLSGISKILSARTELRLQNKCTLLQIGAHNAIRLVAKYSPSGFDITDDDWTSVQFPTAPISCFINSPGGKVVALPIHFCNLHFGYFVLYPVAGCSGINISPGLLDLLASVLSERLHRFILDETIKLREWELEETRSEAIHRLGATAEFRDNDTGWHVLRMSNYALAIAKRVGLSEKDCELLYLTAPMHDIGKIGIPDTILFKPGSLTDEEMAVMRHHTSFGESIFTGDDDVSCMARVIAGSHHERWNGAGYPRGLRGTDIPLPARICAIADVFDALTSSRPYKRAWPADEAAEWIFGQFGKQFDPALLEPFRGALPEILRVRDLYSDATINPRQVMILPPRQEKAHQWFEWDSNLSIGIEAIDEQHRYLFDLCNELHDVVIGYGGACRAVGVIKELEQYAVVHFSAEEKMMSLIKYNRLEAHTRLHRQFCAKLHRERESIHNNPLHDVSDLLKYIVNWLVHHIGIEDIKIKKFIDDHSNFSSDNISTTS